MILTLKCWSCGDSRHVEASCEPQFGFELAQAAQVAGLKAYHDYRYSRVLLFCDNVCAHAQSTATGEFRKYPKKVFIRENKE